MSSHSEITPEIQSLANLAAGLMSLMCVRIRTVCAQRNIDRVAFLTREGVVFKAFYDGFSAAAGGFPKSELLEVSRLSTFPPSLWEEGVDGFARFYSQYAEADLEGTMKSMGAWPPPENIALLINRAMSAGGKRIDIIELAKANPELQRWILQLSGTRRAEFGAYVERAHPWLVNASRALLVDIGWRGTIQDNLARIQSQTHWHGIYIGLFPYLNPQPGNTSKEGLLFGAPDENAPPKAHNVFPVEYLFHVDQGSVTGYSNGSVVFATHVADTGTAYARQFQDALVASAGRCGEAFLAADAQEQDRLTNSWLQDAKEFWTRTQIMTPDLFNSLRQFHHEETFGVGQVIQIDRLLSLPAMVRSIYSRTDRNLFIQHSSSIPLHVRKQVRLGWWLRLWFVLQSFVRGIRRLARARK
jgi:hypothetical protein